ncbi:DUF1772 domain-containing protein [Allomesorhizobium camelthorni]|uniref:DUF1772 domain-containing protein n=1 Tax=Allomesorhizobium camelthorni TaxID=475069 RepID=A0A6G4W5Z7_9HYPH|nr:anthrone oxygenase family protein [Mesorhizobium camelthorni]NGO49597.1 DUF1772 domain-containing protein [Mesorhizobium camelthorni]
MTAGIVFALTFLAALGSGLMAGLFFVFSAFMMTALARLPLGQGMAAMQSINVAILNPAFGAAFFGTAILSVALAVGAAFRWGDAGMAWLLAGSLFYLVGIIAVTMIFNVPLNDALAAGGADTPEGAALWTRYLTEWTAWNHVRTLSGIASLACFIMALR